MRVEKLTIKLKVGLRMEEDNKNKVMGFLLVFALLSTIVMSITIFLFVAYYDYILINFNTIITGLTASGFMGTTLATVFETFVNNTASFINIFDYLWVASFIFLVVEIMQTSYRAKREGYLGLFGFLAYGVMIFLFLSSIMNQLTGFIYDFFFKNILLNVASNLTFFNFYISNYMIINLAILLIAVLINFIDFDTIKFDSRKQKEMINDEV